MKDFLVDETTGALIWENGDLKFGDSTRQNQKALLVANKNEYKQSPTVGVGIFTALHDEGPNDLFRAIRMEMVKDGMKINDLSIKDGIINLEASYDE